MADISKIAEGLASSTPEYWADSHRAEFRSSIVRAVPDEKRYWYVVLDRTIFHPKGGGQPSDRGVLDGEVFRLEVRKVMLAGKSVIVHWGKAVEGMPKEGAVNSKIDWNWRFLLMRRHSAAHLLDHCVAEVLGSDLVTLDSWLSNPCYVAYKGQPPSQEQTVEIERLENRMISKGATVSSQVMDVERLKQEFPLTPNHARLPNTEQLRLVTIEGCKPIACGGTHLRNVSEAVGVKLGRIEPVEGGYRLHFDVLERG